MRKNLVTVIVPVVIPLGCIDCVQSSESRSLGKCSHEVQQSQFF
jgi:hypothetical protein